MSNEKLYNKFAKYFDKIYSGKDYEREANFISGAIKSHKKTDQNSLLDVCCGTGRYIALLKNEFSITGLDINEGMLKIARTKIKGAKVIRADMKSFRLNKKFDVLICMFNSIPYNTNYEDLKKTLNNFYIHLKKGGVVIFDLDLNKNLEGNPVKLTLLKGKDWELGRISQKYIKGDNIFVDLIFLEKKNGKVDFGVDTHVMGCFEPIKVKNIMKGLGFETHIYSDYTNLKWNKNMKKSPIFVGVKMD